MTDTAATTDTAPAARPKLGLILWLVSIGVFVLSILVGVVIGVIGMAQDSLAVLAGFFVPIMASIVYAPLNVGALIASIVGFRRPGVRATREYVALIGSAVTLLLSLGLFGLFALFYGGGF